MTAKQRVDWRTLLLLAFQWVLFLGNFALYALAPQSPIIHFCLGVVAIHVAFTIWHETAHRTVSTLPWLNNAVGVLGMFPYMTPYFMQRLIHLEHHKYLNEPRDPNMIYADGPFWQLPMRYLKGAVYARDMLKKDPRSPAMRRSDLFFLGVVASIWIASLFGGFFFELLLLWGAPFVVAKVIMDWYINFLPHYGLPADRYLGTRILDVPWLTPLILSHNYHAIHHLWPTIPWHQYLATYRSRRDYLDSKHVPIEPKFFGGRTFPTVPESPGIDAG